jgi:hypothetical protein
VGKRGGKRYYVKGYSWMWTLRLLKKLVDPTKGREGIFRFER